MLELASMSRYVDVEQPRGVGQILRDGKVVVSDVRYRVDVRQKMLDAGHGDEIPGLRNISGALLNAAEAHVTTDLIGVEIELKLEDGRRWPCFIQSSAWNLIGRGDIG
jgi:hypothetical protein